MELIEGIHLSSADYIWVSGFECC